MTNEFDRLCETIMSGTQRQPQGNANVASSTQNPSLSGQQTQQTPQQQQAQQQTPQQQTPQQQQPQTKDDDLFNLLQQKMADQKFREQLLKMLNPNQQNASVANNKPV